MSARRVLVPADLAEAVHGDDVDYFDSDSYPKSDVSDVQFYVPPYMGAPEGFAIMSDMPLLKVCQLPTAGYEHAVAFVPDGATLCNAAGVHDASTAELAVGLILASLRGLDGFARAMTSGAWLHDTRPALADRRVIVVGAGGIGRALARRLEGFECEVMLVGTTARDDVQAASDLPWLLPEADVVVLAVPLTESTRGMVDAAFLATMADGALLVNVSRGQVVVTDDLRAELMSGRLSAAVDVIDPEPLPADHVLWSTPGLLISPHVGGNTSAFLPRIGRLVAAQVRRWRSGEPLVNVVS